MKLESAVSNNISCNKSSQFIQIRRHRPVHFTLHIRIQIEIKAVFERRETFTTYHLAFVVMKWHWYIHT